jgi:hypothetical protein
MKRLAWTSQMLALISLSWCVVVGFWIWFTPVRYAGMTGAPGQPDQHTVVYRAFADVSFLGPLPLIIPTLMLAAFAFVAGFSIGSAYMLPAGLLLLATLFAARFGPMRRSRRGDSGGHSHA